MLSNPLHRFSSYNALPVANMMPVNTVPSSHKHHLNGMVQHSQYSFSHLRQPLDPHQYSLGRSPTKNNRHHPYNQNVANIGNRRISESQLSGPVRRRISRACDQCNQLRTKCDGQSPCAHCVEFNLGCEYMRERKKRGKASRKDLAQQAAAAAAAAIAADGNKSPTDHSSDTASDSRMGNRSSTVSVNDNDTLRPESRSMSMHEASGNKAIQIRRQMKANRTRSMGALSEARSDRHLFLNGHEEAVQQDGVESPEDMDLRSYGALNDYGRPNLGQQQIIDPASRGYDTDMHNFSELPYSIQTPSTFLGASQSPSAAFGRVESPLPAFSMSSPRQAGGSPHWMNLTSPNAHQLPSSFHYQSRYPVLQPLVPHLGNIIPVSLACDLLDLYFASSSSVQMHPMSPYLLGYCFRKRSFLHPTKPRICTPALLASMLWVAAQTSEAPYLTSPPSSRGRVCQRLLELTVGLLKPLIHGIHNGDATAYSETVINGVSLGGLGVAMPGTVGMDELNGGSGAFGAAGALDDVVTYIHLATVVSASEYKGASLRWWNAAWSLARELKLGRELPTSLATASHGVDEDADGDMEDDMAGQHVPSSTNGSATEEEREERRRIWWLVYTVDRHLSLCYNKPLFLLDAECDGLLQPMDDTVWQAGEYYSGDSSLHITSPTGSPQLRRRGPNFECTGHSIFGYFTPLMTILGEIVDLNHAKNHPTFGVGFRSVQEWHDHENEITSQLEAYGRSLKAFEAHHLAAAVQMQGNGNGMEIGAGRSSSVVDGSSPYSTNTSTSRISAESSIQTQIVVAYGTHVMHVLHILLTGKWDPISLLDDNDLWISSQSFINATGHAVSAAEAIENILEHDPGLEFMPFFFGVYLLQGSFLLLLIADKLQTEASPSVVKACETIVRAHEACVVTLNTEYQRNFRKVMRSALAQVKGRIPEDFGEQQLRRREVLSLYRWVGNGTGLAL